MEAVLKTWPLKDLQAKCMKHGMAKHGSKEMIIKRILENIPGKRKPGPKPKSAIEKKQTSALKTYPIKLGKSQMDALGMEFVGQGKDANGNAVFKYKPAAIAKLKPKSRPPTKADLQMQGIDDDDEDDDDEDDDDEDEDEDDEDEEE